MRLLFTLIFLNSCSSLLVFAPYPEITPSEISGQKEPGHLTGAFRASTVPGQLITVVNDAAARPPHVGNQKSVNASTLTFEPSKMIGSRTEMGLSFGTVPLGLQLTTKYQLVGETLKKAEAGNYSLSLLAKLGVASYDIVSGDQQVLFGPGGYPYHGDASLLNSSLGVSTGYRISEDALVYTGYGISYFNSRAYVTQEEARNNDVPKGNYAFKKTGNAQTIALGFHFFKKVGLGIRGGWTRFKWNGSNAKSEFHSALYLDFH